MKQMIFDQPERVGHWVAARSGASYSTDTYAFGLEINGELVAGVMYNQLYPKASVAIHMAATKGRYWATREVIQHAFIYPFEHLQVHKLIGYVKEDNLDARQVDEHLGFILETRIKNACVGGDILVYTMTRDQCKYL